MKKIVIVLLVVMMVVSSLCFVACNKDDDEKSVLRFTAPEGTPALAILRMVTDCKEIADKNINYEVVSPSNIASEMASKKSDIVIMPVNAGANLIRQGADYKLVSIAVKGSLFMIGKTQDGGDISFDDIKGKKIACIGQTGVPGLVFRYVMKANGINVILDGTPNADNSEVLVQYVSDGTGAKSLLADGKVDFAVVGEPAATQLKKALSLNAEMNMQSAYANANANNGNDYPQAGLFVRTALQQDSAFMSALIDALKQSKEWVETNAEDVSAFAKANLYESANFPAGSIARCNLSVDVLDENAKQEIITFLKNVMPKDNQGNTIDWDNAKETIF